MQRARRLGAALTGAAIFLLYTTPAIAQDAGPKVVQSLTVPVPTPAQPPAAISAGGDIVEGSHAGYIGVTYALNGRLYDDGVLLRASMAAGEYKGGANPIAQSDVGFFGATALVGYQRKLGKVVVGGFAGPELVHNGYGAIPDVRGTKLAGRVVAEMYAPSKSIDISLWSSYSTFENQYFVQARGLFHKTGVGGGIGPEIAIFGGNGWRRGRAGVHAAFPTSFGAVELGGGYDWDQKGNQMESPYATLGISFSL